jgi:hypothetical protein
MSRCKQGPIGPYCWRARPVITVRGCIGRVDHVAADTPRCRLAIQHNVSICCRTQPSLRPFAGERMSPITLAWPTPMTPTRSSSWSALQSSARRASTSRFRRTRRPPRDRVRATPAHPCADPSGGRRGTRERASPSSSAPPVIVRWQESPNPTRVDLIAVNANEIIGSCRPRLEIWMSQHRLDQRAGSAEIR